MPAESLNDVILDPRHEDAFLGHSDRAANPGEKIQARSLIVAVGARHKHLGVPGEHELENRGVTFCATCDGALPAFRNKPFVVVGGGDTACEKAMYLTRFGSIVSSRTSSRHAPRLKDHGRAHPRESQDSAGVEFNLSKKCSMSPPIK